MAPPTTSDILPASCSEGRRVVRSGRPSHMPETIDLELSVNAKPHALRVEPRETLGEVLRDRMSLTGTKISCDAQVCGACTVLVDGLAVSACTYLAADAD